MNYVFYMQRISCLFISLRCFLPIILFFQSPFSAAVNTPSSGCYVVDNSSYLFDFTEWIGNPFEYDEKDGDLVFRFCKDVESRSHLGYVDFGHFETYHDFADGSPHFHFVQRLYSGDLFNCESTYDKLGRTAQVNLLCGNCSSKICKGELGCMCKVIYDETKCRAIIELAIPCVNRGPRIYEGFTVGFNPRTWEIVYNGMTQVGFEGLHREFSFPTEQTSISLYLTAKSSLSHLVGKPTLVVRPEKGLEAKLSGSATSGSFPTTLTPTMLKIDWRCKFASGSPYETFISIPVDGYDPIEFTLTKFCDYAQREKGDDSSRGWATFGVISCIILVLATISCCGGFIYKSQVGRQRGLDALPGITILSACLESVSGTRGYSMQDGSSGISNQATFASGSRPENSRTGERRYG